MDNFFIAQYFDWRVRRASHLDRAFNLITKRFRFTANTASLIDESIYRLTGLAFSPTRSGISTTIEQRINLYHLVSQSLAYNVPGDLVEVGCNEGQSSVLIAEIMNRYNAKKALHVYDSFEGLPSTGPHDGSSYKAKDLYASENRLIENFTRYRLAIPTIHKGWFQDTLPRELPDRVCFAHLDGDLYESIAVSLEYVYPRLSSGAICLIDDYCDPDINPRGWNHLPGVKKACDEFLNDKPERICYLYSGAFSHGFFRKI